MTQEYSDIELLAEACTVVENNPLGLLCTVDEQGMPFSRWMAAGVRENLGRIFTLTGDDTRKITHLEDNPRVCWVFSSHGQNDVVTLYGRATVETLAANADEWGALVESSRPFAMTAFSNLEQGRYCLIETAVERIEFVSPRLAIFKPRELQVPDHVD